VRYISQKVQRTAFEGMACSVARALDVIGEAWTPLIVRDLSLGIGRFDAIQHDLGISRKVLSERLARLVQEGVVERVPYQDNPPRYDYRLTEKGLDLAPVLVALKAWGDRWAAGEAGPPLLFRHEACGTVGDPVPTCPGCGQRMTVADVTPLAGPGAAAGPGTREVPAALERIARALDFKRT
jgi:DNA-binding HxlR family transcriptional regulator